MESNWIEWLWKRSILVRGFLAALALVTLTDYAFGWERVKFLEFTHAIAALWDHLFGRAIRFVADMLGFPRFSLEAFERHLFALTLILVLPGVLASSGQAWKAGFKSLGAMFFGVIASIGALLFWWFPIRRYLAEQRAWASFAEGDIILLDLTVANPSALEKVELGINLNAITPIQWFIIVLTAASGFFAVHQANKRLFNVIFLGFTFIGSLQLMYYMPILSHWAEDFVDWSKTLDSAL